MKNIQDRAVASDKGIDAENIQWNNGQRARDLGQKLLPVPGVERSKRMTLGRERFPLHRRDQWVHLLRSEFREIAETT